MVTRKQIETDWIEARVHRDRDASIILGLVRDKAFLAAKAANREITDEDILASVKSNYKELKDALSTIVGDGESYEVYKFELKNRMEFLAKYIPVSLNHEDTLRLVSDLYMTGATTIPAIMKALKVSKLNIDMKLANKIAQDFVSLMG